MNTQFAPQPANIQLSTQPVNIQLAPQPVNIPVKVEIKSVDSNPFADDFFKANVPK